MERLQTGQDRSSTSKIIRLNTVPAGQRYAMGMPSYFSSLSMFNAKRPSPHHHDMQGKTILAFRRIVQKKDHTVKNVLLVNALLVILFLSDTHGGRTHDLRMAEATPSPLPAGSGLLQDLGFLSFT